MLRCEQAKINKVMSSREQAVAQMKKEAHLKTERELSLFHDLDGDENNQVTEKKYSTRYKTR